MEPRGGKGKGGEGSRQETEERGGERGKALVVCET